MKKFDIARIKGLTELEIYVIGQALDYHYSLERIKTSLLENVNDYEKVQGHAKTAEIYKTMDRLLNFNKQVFEKVSPEVLIKIVNEDKFESLYTWSSDEDKVIPKFILPSLNSYDKYPSHHPKALIAKKLGATITA